MCFDRNSIRVIFLFIIVVLNIRSYFLFYSDKKKAKTNQPRISEKTLLLASFFLGGVGAWIGMRQFRHKTKKLKFKLLVPMLALLTLGIIYFVFIMI